VYFGFTFMDFSTCYQILICLAVFKKNIHKSAKGSAKVLVKKHPVGVFFHEYFCTSCFPTIGPWDRIHIPLSLEISFV